MAFTQADLDTLDAAILSRGVVRSVTFSDGKSTTFDNVDDMLKMRAIVQAHVNAAAGTPRNVRYGATSKGLC